MQEELHDEAGTLSAGTLSAGTLSAEVADQKLKAKGPSVVPKLILESRNWLVHQLYVTQDHDACLEEIERLLHDSRGQAEYPLYVKGLIKRQRGEIAESLQLFQAATLVNPQNIDNLKQVGRSLYLLGKHTKALEVYAEAEKIQADDWETWQNKGLCYMHLKDYDRALECFTQANNLHKHDSTFMHIGKIHTLLQNFPAAMEVYGDALEHSPENPEILTTLGLLCLRTGDNNRAFDYLGNSLTHDPKNPKTILAAGSIIQDHNDFDVALVKYRVAAVVSPSSPQLWNNIGVCFYGKKKFVAAVACLKRAAYLDPFEPVTVYNLGIVHLATQQYASAFNYFSAAINLQPDASWSYQYLAVTLAKLGDVPNACAAYQKALQLDSTDYTARLNYAITLCQAGEMGLAREQLAAFDETYREVETSSEATDEEIAEQRKLLREKLAQQTS